MWIFLRRHSSKEYRIRTIQMWQKWDSVHALTVFRIFSTLSLVLWRRASLSRTKPQNGLPAQSPSPEENVARQNDVTVLVCWRKCRLKIAALAWSLFKTQKWSKQKAEGTCWIWLLSNSCCISFIAGTANAKLPFLSLGLYQWNQRWSSGRRLHRVHSQQNQVASLQMEAVFIEESH